MCYISFTNSFEGASHEANKIISKIPIFFILKIFVIIKNKKTPEKQGFYSLNNFNYLIGSSSYASTNFVLS